MRTRIFAFIRPLMLVGGAATVLIMGTHTTAAADSVSSQTITMSPASTQISVAPGGTAKNSFDVVNEGDNGYTIVISVAPYHVEGVNYDPEFTPLPGTTDASAWVHISQATTQHLAARQLAAYDYTVTVPAGTAPGGYYAVIFATTTPTTQPTNGVVPHDRVGNVLYITVQGQIKTGGAIIAAGLPHISTASNIPLALLVSNSGGVHYLTNATISVKSIFGQQVFKGTYQRFVLPQTVRKISTTWTHTPAIGLYKVERSATVAGKLQTLPPQWIVVIHPWVIAFILLVTLIIIGDTVWRRKKARAGTFRAGKRS